MTPLSAEVAEAVRLRDAARRDGEFTVVKHPFVGTAVFAPHGVGPVAEFLQAASRHVDLIQRLHSELVKYVGMDSVNVQYQIHQGNEIQALQEENARLHARVRELEKALYAACTEPDAALKP